MGERTATLVLGLGLAIISAAMINLGFLLQHRGLTRIEPGTHGPWALLKASLRRPDWLAGQTLGSVGFGAQIAAVAIAPLALVQAFAAAGLALSLPLAAGLFHHRVRRSEAVAVIAIALALTSLPLGLPTSHDHVNGLTLSLIALTMLALAVVFARSQRGPALAVSAGLCYGVADASIKAIAVLWSHRGADALATGWLALALLGTAAGYLSFQAALRRSNAVGAVALMTATASLVALACGLGGLDEQFGHDLLISTGHVVAVGVVLLCVYALAVAQADLVSHAP